MGFRFSKSIKIAKGLRLNVSKSGLGLSVGPRGASVSFGPRGTYANFGIPGTGISMREKIGGSAQGSRNYSTSHRQDGLTVKVLISIDDETGKETIKLETDDGRPINDDSIMRKVKKTEAFKQKLEEVRLKAQADIAEKTEKLISIYKNSESLTTLEQVKEQADNLKPSTYDLKTYHIKEPVRASLEAELIAKAAREINSWKFWTVKKLRNEFVKNNIENLYNNALSKWRQSKQEFEAEELKRQKEANSEYQKQFEDHLSLLKKIISGDDEYIQTTLEDILSEIQLPLDFNVSYQVKNSVLEVDLDLPEIEAYPVNKAEILQSGKLSIKKKTQNELFQDYARSVFGLAFYFASIFFNISPAIKLIKIAGYTQRINQKIGKIEDQYVYLVEFEREKFSSLNVSEIDPILAIDNFNNKKDMSAKYELRTIVI